MISLTPVKADNLDLSTGSVRIVDEKSLSLENLSIGDHFYNAVIQLNLDGTYSVSSAAEIFIPETASYQVSFDSIWSAVTHPFQYPNGRSHFSGLIGATHNATVQFWQLGETASLGMESMSELGSKSSLQAEVNASITNGGANFLLSGGGIGSSPGSVSLQFQINSSHPLVTLVSMIAPSPDWFIGVSALNLIKNNRWEDELIVPLYAYDTGSDNGVSYTSPNSDTIPKATISLLEELPFLVNGELAPLGTFTFKRLPE